MTETPETEPAPETEEPTPEAVEAARIAADAFARGAVRAMAEQAAQRDGELPARIHDMLLSADPGKRKAGRRLQLLDHQDGGRLGRGLSLAERARFMAA